MNVEREAMRGRLSGLRDQQKKLRLRIEGNARAIRTGLNTALHSVDDLDVPVLDEQWDELKAAWGELAMINANIARLEKELA